MINYKKGIWMKTCTLCGKRFSKNGKRDILCPKCWSDRQRRIILAVKEKQKEYYKRKANEKEKLKT